MNQYEKPEVEIVTLEDDVLVASANISVTPPPDWGCGNNDGCEDKYDVCFGLG